MTHCVIKTDFARAYLESVARVRSLDVEHFAARELEHATNRRCDVFVHAVAEFDHNDGTLARSSYEPSSDGSGTPTDFS